MVGIAASVALGVAVVLWSQKPSYSVLFGNLAAERCSRRSHQVLQQSGIDYEVDPASGLIKGEFV